MKTNYQVIIHGLDIVLRDINELNCVVVCEM